MSMGYLCSIYIEEKNIVLEAISGWVYIGRHVYCMFVAHFLGGMCWQTYLLHQSGTFPGVGKPCLLRQGGTVPGWFIWFILAEMSIASFWHISWVLCIGMCMACLTNFVAYIYSLYINTFGYTTSEQRMLANHSHHRKLSRCSSTITDK